jgi:hypothetical protein
VVAGLPGRRPDNRISTLGRGGSDTSAVALAAALRPTAATSIPTSTASTRPIRASFPRRGARKDRLRGNAGNGLAGRQGAADALGRDRHAAPGAVPRAVDLRPTRAARCFATRKISWKRNRSPASPIPRRSEDHAAPHPRPAGRRRRDLRPARRCRRQCRHDRAERLRGRPQDRSHLHGRRSELARALDAIEKSGAPPSATRT